GPDRSVVQKLRQVIPPFDRDIDLVVATHPDKDHIAGLVTVFDEFDVASYLRSEVHSGTSFDRSLIEREQSEPNIRPILARRGQRIILDAHHGVFLDVLFPDQSTESFKDTNDASIVLKLVYRESSFLLTGDAPMSVEDFLSSRDGAYLHSDVLKLGHHGSKTSSSEGFLKHVQPSYAVVSAGKNNNYHHPNPEVVARVSNLNIPILSTIESGTITFETNGKTIWRK
ncbi:MBL fold metallo-hydrolase, partial [bacterium]|nr:MBL fold metallo-hydrolase [bacterium]